MIVDLIVKTCEIHGDLKKAECRLTGYKYLTCLYCNRDYHKNYSYVKRKKTEKKIDYIYAERVNLMRKNEQERIAKFIQSKKQTELIS